MPGNLENEATEAAVENYSEESLLYSCIYTIQAIVPSQNKIMTLGTKKNWRNNLGLKTAPAIHNGDTQGKPLNF